MLCNNLLCLKTYFEATRLPGAEGMNDDTARMFAEALGAAAEVAHQLENGILIERARLAASAASDDTAELIRKARLLTGASNVVLLRPPQLADLKPLDGGAA